MENSLKFKIGTEEFSVVDLIDKRIDDVGVQRFLQVLKSQDDGYIVHEPMPEDIILPQDNWLSHDAEKMGVGIEFICDEICYLILRTDFFDLSLGDKEVAGILTKEYEWRDLNYTMFLSRKKIDNDLLPNRWIPIFNLYE